MYLVNDFCQSKAVLIVLFTKTHGYTLSPRVAHYGVVEYLKTLRKCLLCTASESSHRHMPIQT